jgi:hypothetical protein
VWANQGAKVSRAGIEIFNGEPMNLGNNGFRDARSTLLYELREVIYNVRLIGNLNGLLFFGATEKRIRCHASSQKKRADAEPSALG